VLNERTTEADKEPGPVKEPAAAPDSEPVRTPVERSEYTSELITTIPFLTNEYEMGPQAQLEVEKVAELMNYYPESKVVLTGHTDSTGMEEFNNLLSMQRASEVAQYLEMRGIGMERITMEGKGETDPVAKNSFSDGSDALLGRYLNRQVHVRITGTLPVDNYLSGLYIPVNLRPVKEATPEAIETEFHYTIQIMATSKPLEDPRFKNVSDVREYVCTDGFYRYTTIAYHTFREARARLLWLRKNGYEDAFIQTREWYEKAIR
jgi:outer membrane protein OmpA-like peptidoglycan-associated protein